MEENLIVSLCEYTSVTDFYYIKKNWLWKFKWKGKFSAFSKLQITEFVRVQTVVQLPSRKNETSENRT
jgi:hypothetical protein